MKRFDFPTTEAMDRSGGLAIPRRYARSSETLWNGYALSGQRTPRFHVHFSFYEQVVPSTFHGHLSFFPAQQEFAAGSRVFTVFLAFGGPAVGESGRPCRPRTRPATKP